MYRIALALSLCLPACMIESAQGPGAHTLETAAVGKTVCKEEQPTGSMMTRRVCRSPEQQQDDQAAKESWMNRSPQNPMQGDFTYPGADARHAHD